MRTRSTGKMWGLVAVGAAAALLFAGCSGSDTDADADAGAGATAPGGGSVTETVDPVEPTTLDAVPLTETVKADDVAISITAVERVELEASTPGDIAGPALAITVAVENEGEKSVDIGTAAVTLVQSDDSAASASAAEPAAPLTGQLEAGKSAEGVYVFSILGDPVNPVTVTVSYAAGGTTVVFTGDVS